MWLCWWCVCVCVCVCVWRLLGKDFSGVRRTSWGEGDFWFYSKSFHLSVPFFLVPFLTFNHPFTHSCRFSSLLSFFFFLHPSLILLSSATILILSLCLFFYSSIHHLWHAMLASIQREEPKGKRTIMRKKTREFKAGLRLWRSGNKQNKTAGWCREHKTLKTITSHYLCGVRFAALPRLPEAETPWRQRWRNSSSRHLNTARNHFVCLRTELHGINLQYNIGFERADSGLTMLQLSFSTAARFYTTASLL